MPTQTTEIQTILNSLASSYTYIAFFSDYDTPTTGDAIATKNEVGRVAPSSSSVSGNTLTLEYTMPTSLTCRQTAVDTGSSSTVFTVDDISGFAVDDRIQIDMSTGSVDRKITGISSSQITIDKPLTGTPATDTVVKLKISQRAVIRGGSVTANTGTIVYIEQWKDYKTSTQKKTGTIATTLDSEGA